MKTLLLLTLTLFLPNGGTGQGIDWNRVHESTMRGLNQLYNLNVDSALATFDSVSHMAPGDPRGPFFTSMVHFYLYNLSLSERELDKFFDESEKVIDICEHLLDQNEHDATTKFYLGGIYGYRGLAYQSSGSILKAVRDGRKGYIELEEAVQERPDLYDAQMGFGLFRYAIAKVPRSMSYVLSLLGFSGDLEGGLHSLRLAAEKGTYTRTEATLFLSQFLFNEGRQDTALKYLTGLREEYPENTLFHVLYASWQNRLGDIDRAYPAIEKAMELNATKKVKYGEEFIYSTLGSIYFTKSLFDSSMIYYRRFMSMSKNDERTPNIIFLRAGEACEIAGDRATALGFYGRMKEPGDRTWDTYNYRRGQQLIFRPLSAGDILLIRAANESTLKHYSRSLELYRQAAAAHPADADLQLRALYGIQEVQFDSSLFADAVNTSLRLVALKPISEGWILPHAWFKLGLIYERLGNIADARKALGSVGQFDGYDFQNRLEEQVKDELSKLDSLSARSGSLY